MALPPGCPPPPDGVFWVFTYGSLMWNPGFPYEEARPARLRGYHRAFCLYSHHYRGTAERPGLVLGLDRGGSCHGIAYRVAPAHAERAMAYLWEREMDGYEYAVRDLPIAIATGPVMARTFVVRRDKAQYAGKLPAARMVAIIRAAHGRNGSNRAYLENTVRHLEALGIPDRRLRLLLAAVEAGPGGGPGGGLTPAAARAKSQGSEEAP
jgi:cation transport protein ChaC